MSYVIKEKDGVTVSTDVYYLPMSSCPKASKVILLTVGGVAIISKYYGEPDYRGWFPMPRERKNG